MNDGLTGYFVWFVQMFEMQTDTRAEAMLRRENHDLRQQLRQVESENAALRTEVTKLRRLLAKYQLESSQEEELLRTPKMRVEEHFQGSSEQEAEVETSTPLSIVRFQSASSPSPAPSPVPLSHSTTLSNCRESDGSRLMGDVNRSSSKRVIISKYVRDADDEEHSYHRRKEINRVLKKSSQRRKEEAQSTSPFKAISTREIEGPKANLFGRDIQSVKSEKVLFRKTSNSRPIFDCFFVTGMTKEGPCIAYAYPHGSGHSFEAYLSLMYGENSLKQADLSPSGGSRGRLATGIARENPFSVFIKDTFVIPIMKAQSRSSERDFLVVCQVQEAALERDLAGCHFPRYYCFLSQWKFFAEFRKLISQLIDRIHLRKKSCSELSQQAFTRIVQQQVEQGIGFLHQKSTDYNKTLDCCIGGSGLKFSVDIPPVELSYQMVEKYQQWEVMGSTVQVREGEEQGGKETELLGVLLAYTLAEVKVVLFSSTKSKVSEAILQLLEIMRPLTYVNPILMAALKDDYQNYLDAPMSLLLGLWAEPRRSARQKIEIFMNKKMNLLGLIQKAKLTVPDGVVFNLDTGLVFGGGVRRDITEVAIRLNAVRRRFGKSRETYKMVEKMLQGRFESEQAREAWTMLRGHLERTQMYCYYLQNKESE